MRHYGDTPKNNYPLLSRSAPSLARRGRGNRRLQFVGSGKWCSNFVRITLIVVESFIHGGLKSTLKHTPGDDIRFRLDVIRNNAIKNCRNHY
jgi:hypothetical protein